MKDLCLDCGAPLSEGKLIDVKSATYRECPDCKTYYLERMDEFDLYSGCEGILDSNLSIPCMLIDF
jgi:hypothetical protein